MLTAPSDGATLSNSPAAIMFSAQFRPTFQQRLPFAAVESLELGNYAHIMLHAEDPELTFLPGSLPA